MSLIAINQAVVEISQNQVVTIRKVVCRPECRNLPPQEACSSSQLLPFFILGIFVRIAESDHFHAAVTH